MDRKLEWKYRWETVKDYLPFVKKLSKKGSPTLEYVILIAAGAAFAGLLLFAFKGGEENKITKTLKEKVNNVVEDSGNLEEVKDK